MTAFRDVFIFSLSLFVLFSCEQSSHTCVFTDNGIIPFLVFLRFVYDAMLWLHPVIYFLQGVEWFMCSKRSYFRYTDPALID